MKAKTTFTQINPEFSRALRQRVEEYFSTNGKRFTGNFRLYFKSIILILTAVGTYVLLLADIVPVWAAILLCVALGLNLASIGFNLMHEGAHGSYSRKRWVNEIMGYSLNALGGNVMIWKQKHNQDHHTYTNIQGHDSDIDIEPWIRTNQNQKKYWYHRYQHYYWIILYGLTYFIWVFSQDFRKYFTGKIAEHSEMRRMKWNNHVMFWLSKLTYFFAFLVLPVLLLGFWETVIGYAIISFSCGWVLAVVFQLAHLVEDTSFPMPDPESKVIDNEWTIHQLATTANFSTRSKIVSWFVGGLNFQIEHHLFPKISHVHYPAVSKLVKEVCHEFNVKYIEHRTVFHALRSHVIYLKSVSVA